MKNSILAFFILLMTVLGISAYNQIEVEGPTFKLVWEDEFDENRLDTTVWSPVIGDGCPRLCGWGNNELQYYRGNENNIRFEDGSLVLEARKEKVNGREFTSGKLITKNKADWKYGKIEVRAMLPCGTGTWPAIWMLPTIENREGKWPGDGEIDIMEHVGHNHGMIHGTAHTGKYNGMYGTHKSDSIFLEDVHKKYHTYSIEWTEESITWFADGTAYHKLEKDNDIDEWPFNQFNYHLIINFAVGGNWGGKHGVDEGVWPQAFKIDYVRYYKLLRE